MKKIILILLFTVNAAAQGFYIGGALDPKMLIEGPTAESYSDIGGSFNYELRLGWEIDKDNDGNGLRLGIGFENHNLINYTKAFLQGDYILMDWLFDGFNCYAGPEISVITRTPPPNGWRRQERSFSVGTNFEVQYEITENFSIGLNYNAFYGEAAMIRDAKTFDQKIRTDLMVGLYFKNLNFR